MSEIWVQIFRAGNHTDSAGRTSEWSAEDVTKIATMYNERVTTQINNEAPIVKGHPKTDDPAFGWAKELKVEDGILKARIEFTDVEFEQEVKDKKYKNISIALNEDLSLRHIGFLGAVPPAVKELEAPEFNENENQKTTWYISAYYFSEFEDEQPTKEITKPAKYSDYSDDEFGDNLNFKFPIRTREEVLSSIRNFGKENVWSQYSPYEYQRIWARILSQATKFNIKQNPNIWDFSEVPSVNTNVNTNTNISTNNESQNINISKTINQNANKTEFNEMEQLQKLFADMIAWANSNISAEAGSQLQAQFESQVAEVATQLQDATTQAQSTASEMEQKFNATNKIVKELQDKLLNTEIENELNKYDLTEKEFNEVKQIYKTLSQTKEFSEKGMESTILSLLSSKKKADKSEGSQFSQGTAPAVTQHEAITNIMNTQKLSYTEATKKYFEIGVK